MLPPDVIKALSKLRQASPRRCFDMIWLERVGCQQAKTDPCEWTGCAGPHDAAHKSCGKPLGRGDLAMCMEFA